MPLCIDSMQKRLEKHKCSKFLKEFSRILHDEKISPFESRLTTNNHLYNLQNQTKKTLKYIKKKSYITETQLKELNKVHTKYQKIVNLNSTFDYELKRAAIILLEDILSFSEPHIPELKNEDRRMLGAIKVKADQIKRQEYFWHCHLSEAVKFLESCRLYLDTEDLEKRTSNIYNEIILK